jgi:hypothetical protein
MNDRRYDDRYDTSVQSQVGNNLLWILAAVVAIIFVGAIAMGVRDHGIPGPPIPPPAYNSIGAIEFPATNASSLTLVKGVKSDTWPPGL